MEGADFFTDPPHAHSSAGLPSGIAHSGSPPQAPGHYPVKHRYRVTQLCIIASEVVR